MLRQCELPFENMAPVNCGASSAWMELALIRGALPTPAQVPLSQRWRFAQAAPAGVG